MARILLVASRYLPHRGGLETVVHELAQRMRLEGHSVLIVTNRYPRSLPAREMSNGVPVTRLQFLYPRVEYLLSGRLLLFLAGLVYFPITLVRLFILIRRFRPDLVNLHYLGNPGLFLLIAAKLLRFRLVVSLHGGDVDGEPQRNRFNRRLFRAVLRQAQSVTACSRYLMDRAVEIAPEIESKAFVIHNGVDYALFSGAAPFVHPHPYLLAVGQLEQHKGFDLLLSAFSRVAREHPAVDLIIAGHGGERQALFRQSQAYGLTGRVHFQGAATREQVASLMRGCLAVVIPSRREPFGIVALEARASGKPVIASRVGGLPEALAGTDSILVEPGSVQALCDSLSAFLSNSHRPKIADGSLAANGFSWERVYRDYAHVYGLAN